MSKTSEKVIRLGGGGGFAGDRIDAAVELGEHGNIQYLCWDSLSENELSLVTMRKLSDPSFPGYDTMLERRMKEILPLAIAHKIKIVSNMGSTNPIAAAEYISQELKELGHRLRVAAIAGDNVRDYLLKSDFVTVEDGKLIREFGESLVAAHAYAPSVGIEHALCEGADIILTGRVGDSALFLGALRHEFNWSETDWDKLATGTMIGHQLECAAQLSGGYFADPPYKVVEHGDKLGFPIAEVHANGEVFFTKTDESGGVVSVDTCKEQALYEVHDPANYKHAEVTVDLSAVNFQQVSKDRVQMFGVRGKPAPDSLKVALGVREGYFSTTTIWFGGPGARTRAEWARETLYARFERLGFKPDALGIFLMGIDGMYGDAPGVPKNTDPWEVGVRVAARSHNKEELEIMMLETAGRMTTNGPAAPSCEHGSWFVREVVAYYHTFIPRDAVNLKVTLMEN
jgi:hypothetical protein